MSRALLALALLGFASCTPAPTYELATDAGSTKDGSLASDAAGPDGLHCTHCLIFTSTYQTQGNFLGANGVGVTDAICTQLGRLIPGKEDSEWKVFLWADGISPFERLKSPKDGWYSVKQVANQLEYRMFANLDAMRTDMPPAALQITEQGLGIGAPYRVWTGGGATRGADNCQNWTSAGTDYGVYGNPEDSNNWGEAGKWVCNAFGRLYCVEQ